MRARSISSLISSVVAFTEIMDLMILAVGVLLYLEELIAWMSDYWSAENLLYFISTAATYA